MGFTKGQKVTLKKVALYVSSDAKSKANTVSGTYYIWSAATKNGRIRITDKKSYAGKNPAGKYVTGWVNTGTLTSGSSGGSSSKKTKKDDPSSTVKTTIKKQTKNTTDSVTPKKTVAGQVGYLGQVVFVVSNSTIKTLNNFVWSQTATYAEHERHGKRSMLEFTGVNAEDITFTIELSAHLGCNPLTEYKKLRTYQRNGTVLPLKIGKTAYGYYRWVITSLSLTGEYWTTNARFAKATVAVTLKAYEKK